MPESHDPFGARAPLPNTDHAYYRLDALSDQADLGRLPFSIKVLLESLLRACDESVVKKEDVVRLANWQPKDPHPAELPFRPARVLLQDFTGVPSVVDLAAMRAAVDRMGGDPRKVNPQIPVDLVIDHSVQVDRAGSADALRFNAKRDYERNAERYAFLKWGRQAFDGFRVVPPSTGIVHQVNLEYLAHVVMAGKDAQGSVLYPDSLVGTDSHTTMINGLGVLGWGVGGIEAEAAMLGQPVSLLTPEVIGVRLSGRIQPGATATDVVLAVTQTLRARGVVGTFVEFFGPGLDGLTLPDRATIANMCPEYGATAAVFPVDGETLRYLRATGRSEDKVRLVERYTRAQGLFHESGQAEPDYTEVVEIDLARLEAALAGPRRPQDRVPLGDLKASHRAGLTAAKDEGGYGVSAEETGKSVPVSGMDRTLRHGDVVLAAITSCTNTSNPSVMIGAGLLARNAVRLGLRVPPFVKTSLAPGSRVVEDYLRAADLLDPLEALGFHVVGFGCTTCIGNSGPLAEPVSEAIRAGGLVVSSVLSGNRNFEGRIHPEIRANYLASPPLVVAFALAGTVDIDLTQEPIGVDSNDKPVFLRDLWPDDKEISAVIERTIKPELFHARYGQVFDGDDLWKAIPAGEGNLFDWDTSSTYVREPPFFEHLRPADAPIENIRGARVLAYLGDSVTTDHISPAGAIARNSPAAKYLVEQGVEPEAFNTYGARRGNDQVMTRGTFANIRLRNRLAPETEGGWTTHTPTGEVMSIYDAAMRYRDEGTPLLVIAGEDYGMGSSRDWAAKGTRLLGVRMVLARSYERIHRSNLIGMGILPLQFKAGQGPEDLGLDGTEVYSTLNLDRELTPGSDVELEATRTDGTAVRFTARCRIDTPLERLYFQNGGILPTVLRDLV